MYALYLSNDELLVIFDLYTLHRSQKRRQLDRHPYYTRQFTGAKSRSVERYDTYHYISILSTLERLLSDSSVIEHLETFPCRICNDGVIEDFCDAATFKNHLCSHKTPRPYK